jgi:hypothetical protein
MSLIDCPVCHASFHIGPIYERLDACPRCGAGFAESAHAQHRHVRPHLHHRRAPVAAPDWEAITAAQYAHRPYAPTAAASSAGDPARR